MAPLSSQLPKWFHRIALSVTKWENSPAHGAWTSSFPHQVTYTWHKSTAGDKDIPITRRVFQDQLPSNPWRTTISPKSPPPPEIKHQPQRLSPLTPKKMFPAETFDIWTLWIGSTSFPHINHHSPSFCQQRRTSAAQPKRPEKKSLRLTERKISSCGLWAEVR